MSPKLYLPGDFFVTLTPDTGHNVIGIQVVRRFKRRRKDNARIFYELKYIFGKRNDLDPNMWYSRYYSSEYFVLGRYKLGKWLNDSDIRFATAPEAALILLRAENEDERQES